jgi:TonB family protein
MRIFKGFVASVMIHLFFFTSCYLLVIWWKNSPFSAVDIDLRGSSLLLRPAKPVLASKPAVTKDEEWYISGSTKLAAAPVKVTFSAAPAAHEAPAEAACPPPCPSNPSDWAAVGSASRRPAWVEGLISEDDYPKDARAQGLEGTVKVDVFIDTHGTVRDVRVISSSDTRFSDVVVRKLKSAKFEPALDGAGNPMAVHMAMPIAFKLH